MLTGLAILGDTSLELTSTGGDDENSTIGLGGTSNHVLDEITVTGSINNGDIVQFGGQLGYTRVVDGVVVLPWESRTSRGQCRW